VACKRANLVSESNQNVPERNITKVQPLDDINSFGLGARSQFRVFCAGIHDDALRFYGNNSLMRGVLRGRVEDRAQPCQSALESAKARTIVPDMAVRVFIFIGSWLTNSH
jgi:hypothetical protein